MKKAVLVAPTIFEYSDPHNLLELAKDTEEAGWEGFFICDHLLLDPDGQLGLADPSIMLGAIAAITDKVIIGSMVTPVSRRRPWKLAKEFASLDQLSNGACALVSGCWTRNFRTSGKIRTRKSWREKRMKARHHGEAAY